MVATEGQTVYMLVDRTAGAGSGAVVGMLKVGRKKLFLLDRFERIQTDQQNCYRFQCR